METQRINKYLFLSLLFGLVAFIIILPDLGSGWFNQFLIRFPGLDKAAHTIEHMIIVLALNYVFKRIWRICDLKKRIVVIALLSMLISLIDEGHQIFTPNRNVEIADLFANFLGASIGLFYVASPIIGRQVSIVSILLCSSVASYITYNSYSHLKDYYSGMRFEKARQFELARVHYQKSVESGQDIPAAYNSLAWVYIEYLDNNYTDALKYSSYAVSRSPDNADFLDTHGWALYKAKKYKDALHYLKNSFELNSTIYCINYHLGMTYYQLGNLEQARKHFDLQLAFSPTDFYARRTNKQLAIINSNKNKL